MIVLTAPSDMPVFHYHDERHCLWSRGAPAEVKALMVRMAAVVQPMVERVKAELSDAEVICKFCAFDLAEWNKPDHSDGRRLVLKQAFRSLCKCLQQDPRQGQEEFAKALPAAIQECAKALAAAIEAFRTKRAVGPPLLPGEEEDEHISVDNRVIWGELLTANLLVGCRVLPLVIRLYLAVPLGTPDVERGLGRLSRVLTDHTGPLSGESVWALVSL